MKNGQKHFFSLKLTKNAKKTRGEIFCTFSSMKSRTLYSKLGNFVTSWNMTKTPQNFVQGSFSIKLTKEFHKNRIEDLASGPYQHKPTASPYLCLRIYFIELILCQAFVCWVRLFSRVLLDFLPYILQSKSSIHCHNKNCTFRPKFSKIPVEN